VFKASTDSPDDYYNMTVYYSDGSIIKTSKKR